MPYFRYYDLLIFLAVTLLPGVSVTSHKHVMMIVMHISYIACKNGLLTCMHSMSKSTVHK